MPYTIKTVETGDYKTTYIYAERPTAGTRGKKNKPTSALQDKLNERMSEARFREIVHMNFTTDDFSIRLDYNHYIRKFGENPTVEIAQSRLRYYFRKLKKIYEALDIEFAYIYVIEVGKRSGKVHHHIILRGASDPDTRMYLRHMAEELWSYGYGNTQPLEFSENGLKGLVHYFIKDPSTTRRWACSLGLKRPTEENGAIRRRKNAISAKAAKHIDANPYDLEFIKKHAIGEGYTPVEVRVTANSAMEDATPYELPDVTDAAAGIYNGMVMPDYGGVFIEIWSYKTDTDLFVPVGLNKRIKKPKKQKKTSEADKGGNCL